MKSTVKHMWVGFLFLGFVCAIFLYNLAGESSDKYVSYQATFNNVGGVFKGTPVYIAGVKVGRVEDMTMGMHGVDIKILVNKALKIPVDSVLQIETFSFFSQKVVSISPGFEEATLRKGAYFQSVQNSIDFFGLLMAYLNTRVAKKKGK